MPADTSRLDNFTDAAFAFAVTLLVIGGGAMPARYGDLEAALANLPAFAMGFALIGMFWHAHVRWRRMCGSGDPVSVILTFLLVFLVLVYVYPLRLIAVATMAWFMGDEPRMAVAMGDSDAGGLFTIYGCGFVAMSATVGALFLLGRKRAVAGDDSLSVKVEIGIWTILVVTGFVSIALAQVPGIAEWAGTAYAALPVLIGVWVAWATRSPPLQSGGGDAT